MLRTMIDRALVGGDGTPFRLRTLGVDDARAFAACVASDVGRLGRYLTWPDQTTTPDGATAFLGQYERQEGGRILMAGIWVAGELLGGVALIRHDPVHANAEFGCWIAAPGAGRGIVSTGCRALIRMAIDLGIQRLTWECAPQNVASRRLADHLGFRYEGTARADYVVRDERLDTDRLSLVGDELADAGRRPPQLRREADTPPRRRR